MNNQLEQQLMNRFPFMEAENYLGKKLGYPIHHDFQDGWYKIIECLCTNIAADLTLYPNPDFAVIQSKEKYGTLRFYTTSIPLNSKIFGYISDAETESANTCEICGSTEDVDLYGDYWVATRCKNCGVSLK